MARPMRYRLAATIRYAGSRSACPTRWSAEPRDRPPPRDGPGGGQDRTGARDHLAISGHHVQGARQIAAGDQRRDRRVRIGARERQDPDLRRGCASCQPRRRHDADAAVRVVQERGHRLVTCVSSVSSFGRGHRARQPQPVRWCRGHGWAAMKPPISAPAHPSVMDPVRFGIAIRALRRRRGWTQQELADHAGTSQAAVSRAERGGARADDDPDPGTDRGGAWGASLRAPVLAWRGARQAARRSSRRRCRTGHRHPAGEPGWAGRPRVDLQRLRRAGLRGRAGVPPCVRRATPHRGGQVCRPGHPGDARRRSTARSASVPPSRSDRGWHVRSVSRLLVAPGRSDRASPSLRPMPRPVGRGRSRSGPLRSARLDRQAGQPDGRGAVPADSSRKY